MRASSRSVGRYPRRPSDHISIYTLLLLGVSVASIVISMVALPLAFSSPFADDDQVSVADDAPAAKALTVSAIEVQPLEPVTDGRMVLASLGDASDRSETFSQRWNDRVPQAAAVEPTDEPGEEDAGDAVEEGAGTVIQAPLAPVVVPRRTPAAAVHEKVATPPKEKAVTSPRARVIEPKKVVAPPVDRVEQYLWEVYLRRPVKEDSGGNFTWKDQAAAKRLNMSLRSYVIGGMDPDFREALYHAGHAMDASGLRWSMLSAFRDDYRQGIATGFKAHGGNSQHGGSRATGGYGHGRAIDITCSEGGDAEAIWHWIDAHGAKYGLLRPMARHDPAHIQARGSYHEIAKDLRGGPLRLAHKHSGATARLSSSSRMAARIEK